MKSGIISKYYNFKCYNILKYYSLILQLYTYDILKIIYPVKWNEFLDLRAKLTSNNTENIIKILKVNFNKYTCKKISFLFLVPGIFILILFNFFEYFKN